jgi:hypothetical protein
MSNTWVLLTVMFVLFGIAILSWITGAIIDDNNDSGFGLVLLGIFLAFAGAIIGVGSLFTYDANYQHSYIEACNKAGGVPFHTFINRKDRCVKAENGQLIYIPVDVR